MLRFASRLAAATALSLLTSKYDATALPRRRQRVLGFQCVQAWKALALYTRGAAHDVLYTIRAAWLAGALHPPAPKPC